MGIPHLTTTLQPCAHPHVLENEAVVIDGPALAYHILHICRVNGAIQPSYNLVALSTLKWLDELVDRGVVIEAIYFDGYLPPSKRTVRMERMMKNSVQINRLFSTNPQCCPRNEVAIDDREHLRDVFSLGVPRFKPFTDPSFFVPAIIESLRRHSRYRNPTHVVPGEADTYCASHVSKRGGLILTSDSDLLVYNLGCGKVVFFRDLYMDVGSEIRCSIFAPVEICKRLSLSPSTGLLRLGYEQKRAPQSTLSQIAQACSRKITDKSEYREFCEQYQLHDDNTANAFFHPSDDGQLHQITDLDPRVSELVVQLHHSSSMQRSLGEDAASIFLPILIEDPRRGSAWEHSMPIRQLAYTLLQMRAPRVTMPVLEYRRVQSVTQRGRRIEIMSNTEAQNLIGETLDVMTRMTEIAQNHHISHWLLICLAVDLCECQKQGKLSHAWRILQQPHKPSIAEASKISWDIVHFFAHIQAALYSFRILCQVLSVTPEWTTKLNFPSNAKHLWSELQHLPPLSMFPDIDSTIQLLLTKSYGLVQELSESLHLTMLSTPGLDSEAKLRKGVKNWAAGRAKREGSRSLTSRPKVLTRANRFDPLSMD